MLYIKIKTLKRNFEKRYTIYNPTMDDLNALPYMDAVARDTLRLYPAVSSVLREARKDDCIPLSTPFADKKGIVCNEIR
jgi:hypothetical protein